MNETFRHLHRSARLVRTWGATLLPTGKTLAETFSIEGIPLWDAFAVDLARLYVPDALSTKPGSNPAKITIRPYLSWFKHVLKAYLRKPALVEAEPSWPHERVFLYLGFGHYLYRDVLHPVVTCAADNRLHAISLFDQAVDETASLPKEEGFHSIWAYWSRDVANRFRVMKQGLQKAINELHLSGVLPSIIRDGEIELWPRLQSTFLWFFRLHLPRLLAKASIAAHILERHRPALVVSPDVADPHSRLYCLIGHRLGIPSLGVQFGMCWEDSIEWQFPVMSRVAVWGQTARDVLMNHGVADDQIVITGSPRHDVLVRFSNEEAIELRAQLGIDKETVLVLFASVYQLPAYDNLFDSSRITEVKSALFAAADQASGLQLVVKPHPREDVEQTKELAGNRRNIQFVDASMDIRDLINVCDVFVSLGSTATIDALILGKLTVCPEFPGWIWSDLFVKSGATIVPRSAAELASLFQAMANGSGPRLHADLEGPRKMFLERWVHRPDGRAAERIKGLAVQIVENTASHESTVVQ